MDLHIEVHQRRRFLRVFMLVDQLTPPLLTLPAHLSFIGEQDLSHGLTLQLQFGSSCAIRGRQAIHAL